MCAVHVSRILGAFRVSGVRRVVESRWIDLRADGTESGGEMGACRVGTKYNPLVLSSVLAVRPPTAVLVKAPWTCPNFQIFGGVRPVRTVHQDEGVFCATLGTHTSFRKSPAEPPLRREQALHAIYHTDTPQANDSQDFFGKNRRDFGRRCSKESGDSPPATSPSGGTRAVAAKTRRLRHGGGPSRRPGACARW